MDHVPKYSSTFCSLFMVGLCIFHVTIYHESIVIIISVLAMFNEHDKMVLAIL